MRTIVGVDGSYVDRICVPPVHTGLLADKNYMKLELLKKAIELLSINNLQKWVPNFLVFLTAIMCAIAESDGVSRRRRLFVTEVD